MLRLSQANSLWTRLLVRQNVSMKNWVALFSEQAGKPTSEQDDDTFELLPPGCSMIDPSYTGEKDQDEKVYRYDEPPDESDAKKPDKKGISQDAPANVSVARERLKKKGAQKDDNLDYVYLPPGCSIADPAYNSVSDPQDPRPVNRIDPNPNQ